MDAEIAGVPEWKLLGREGFREEFGDHPVFVLECRIDLAMLSFLPGALRTLPGMPTKTWGNRVGRVVSTASRAKIGVGHVLVSCWESTI